MVHSTQIRRFLVASVALVTALSASPALAGGRSGNSGGALSRTTSGVRSATRAPSRPATSVPTRPVGSSGVIVQPDFARPYCVGCAIGVPGPAPVGARRVAAPAPTRLQLDLGLQSVEDSDGAMLGELRISRGGLGAVFSGTRYFERVGDEFSGQTLYMNVWELAFAARGLASGNTELWISGGLGGTSSNDFEGLTGVVVGARLQHRLTDSLSITSAARYFAFEDEITSVSFTRGVQYSVGLSASYSF